MPVVALVIFVILALVALVPVSLIQRFRMGTVRRPARRWVATLNLAGVTSSIGIFLLGALITSRWVPEVLTYTLAGLALGGILGVAGLALTRWESIGGRLHYTPNRWLVLTITLVVTARVLYGFWRSWEAWQAALDRTAWFAASGIATSMSAGAVVLGYYLVYWSGVRRHIGRHGLDAWTAQNKAGRPRAAGSIPRERSGP